MTTWPVSESTKFGLRVYGEYSTENLNETNGKNNGTTSDSR